MKTGKASLLGAILIVIVLAILVVLVFMSGSLDVTTALIAGGVVFLLFAVVYVFIALRVKKE